MKPPALAALLLWMSHRWIQAGFDVIANGFKIGDGLRRPNEPRQGQKRFFASSWGILSPLPPTSVNFFSIGEKDLSVGIVSSIQTHGSLANWHPHLHMLVTDGGFRPDGTFVHFPLHDVATLTEAFRRAVLKMFVKRDLMDIETAQSMLA